LWFIVSSKASRKCSPDQAEDHEVDDHCSKRNSVMTNRGSGGRLEYAKRRQSNQVDDELNAMGVHSEV
jgi:hypothetical protein